MGLVSVVYLGVARSTSPSVATRFERAQSSFLRAVVHDGGIHYPSGGLVRPIKNVSNGRAVAAPLPNGGRSVGIPGVDGGSGRRHVPEGES